MRRLSGEARRPDEPAAEDELAILAPREFAGEPSDLGKRGSQVGRPAPRRARSYTTRARALFQFHGQPTNSRSQARTHFALSAYSGPISNSKLIHRREIARMLGLLIARFSGPNATQVSSGGLTVRLICFATWGKVHCRRLS